MNFAGLIRGLARRLPDKEALVDGERRFSFGTLWRHVTAVSRLYRERGVEPGDRVLLVLPSGAEFLICHFAALAMGAVSVPVKAEYRSFEVGRILADCRPRVLITTAPWLRENGAGLGEGLAGVTLLPGEAMAQHLDGGDGIVAPLPSTAAASINYSYFGGGCARGAVLSHGNHIYAATGYAGHQGFTAQDRLLIILPMAHVYALSGCVNSGLLRGGTLVILDRVTPRAVFGAIQSHRITILSAVPAIYELLARFPNRERYDTSTLRQCVTGGDFMPAARQRELEAAMGARMVQGYGLTECLPVICNPPDGGNRHGTLGIPGRRDIELRIVGASGEVLPPREEGEIAIRSPTTMRAYHGRPGDTARILRDDWLYTGDEGYLDEDGYLHFVGLRKKILNVYGNKVDPLEVAEALREHPAVEAAEVVGGASVDPRLGGAIEISAEVVLKAGRQAAEEELKRHLRGRIAAYKVPARIAVRRTEPRLAAAQPGGARGAA